MRVMGDRSALRDASSSLRVSPARNQGVQGLARRVLDTGHRRKARRAPGKKNMKRFDDRSTLSLAALLGAFALPLHASASTGGAATEARPLPPPLECGRDADCPSPSTCVDGTCTYAPEPCSSDATCDEGYVCTPIAEYGSPSVAVVGGDLGTAGEGAGGASFSPGGTGGADFGIAGADNYGGAAGFAGEGGASYGGSAGFAGEGGASYGGSAGFAGEGGATYGGAAGFGGESSESFGGAGGFGGDDDTEATAGFGGEAPEPGSAGTAGTLATAGSSGNGAPPAPSSLRAPPRYCFPGSNAVRRRRALRRRLGVPRRFRVRETPLGPRSAHLLARRHLGRARRCGGARG